METNQIIENNKLIAEFMGLKTGKELGYDRWHSDYFDNQCVINGQRNTIIEFHTSWNWLMPVVEKVENLEYVNREGRFSVNSINFEENYTAYVIDGSKGLIQVEGEDKITAIYNAVTEFIKWYNLNK